MLLGENKMSNSVVPLSIDDDVEHGLSSVTIRHKTSKDKGLAHQLSNNTELWAISSTTANTSTTITTKTQSKVGNEFFKPAVISATSTSVIHPCAKTAYSPSMPTHNNNNNNNHNNHNNQMHHKEDVFVTHRDYETIKTYLTFYYGLKDSTVCQEFLHFNESRRSVGLFYFFMTLIFTVIVFPASTLEFFSDIHVYDDYHNHPKYAERLTSSAVLFINNLSGIVSSWYLLSVYFPCKTSFLTTSFPWVTQFYQQSYIRLAKNVVICCIQVFFLGMLAQRCLNLNCVTPINAFSRFFNGQLCYEGIALYNILLAQSFVALSIPLIISVNLPEVSIEFIWSNFLLAAVTIFLVCIATNQFDAMCYLLIWFGVVLFSIIDIQVRKITMFFVNMDLNRALSEVRRIEEEHRANEMRHMIANVAHDLKTPLSSLSSGIEFIHLLLTELHSKFTASSLRSLLNTNGSREDVIGTLSHLTRQSLEGISACLLNMRDTNSFMLMTINRCIDYTKATKGIKLVPHLETIHVLESLQLPINCIQNLQDRITVQLLPIPSSICSYVFTDKQWLRENMLCLLSNAVKYSTGGEVRIRIQVTSLEDLKCRQDHNNQSHKQPQQSQDGAECTLTIREGAMSDSSSNSFLLIEVEDTGIGLSKDYQSQLFQPFRQTQRLTGGTGLGLFSLAKRIEALSGYYGVHNRHDGQRGCVFWFAVPYSPDELTASMKGGLHLDTAAINVQDYLTLKQTVPTPMSVRKARNKLKVLVVDDSPAIVKMTTMLLKKKGFDTATAENGQVAVDKINALWQEEKEQYDVILMDLQMPVMDGLEATKCIRGLEKDMVQPQVIVGMSANSDHETKQAAISIGMDTFVAKPFNMQQFQEILQSHGLFSMV